MPDFAPVAVFAFNRPEHLRQTLSALAACLHACESHIYVVADGIRGPHDAASVSAVAEVLSEFRNRRDFAQFSVSSSPINKGLSRSVIEGVSALIEEHRRVIVLEDDIMVTPHFIESMNNGLRDLDHRKDIWSLSGYSPPITIPADYSHQAYLTGRASSWGWATWADRWHRCEWERSAFAELAASQKFRREFSRGGLDLPIILDAYLSGDAASWAVRWCAIQCREGGLTVYPTTSLVTNLGTDGSGTNSPVSSKYSSETASDRIDFSDIPAIPDARIQRRFRKFHLSQARLYGSRLKQSAKKLRRHTR